MIFALKETILGSEKSQNITIEKNENDENTDEDQEIIQGVFSLKYLLIFTKCTNFMPNRRNIFEKFLSNYIKI